VAEQSLRAFNAAYGAYPFSELEVVQAALTKFLGVEYPGIMLIEQGLYERNGRSLESTIAHEIGHQWWYGLVGNDAQGEAWLDEGLTSFSQLTYYRALGQNDIAERELQGFRDSYLSLRRRGLDQPLNRSPGELRGIYVPVVYAKAALFFEALRLRLGNEDFSEFVQDYFATLRYREATGPDVLAAAQRACECDLTGFYRDWVTTAAPVDIP
jgi:aminopeptidase N